MIWIYRYLLLPIVFAATHISALFLPKIRDGLRQRREKVWADSPPGRTVMWIHAASGEFEYAKPLITALKAADPNLYILVTYFSPTYAPFIARFPGVDAHGPLPWDSQEQLQHFLKTVRPHRLLIARTDLWPECLHQTRAAGIPITLFSATLAQPAAELSLPVRLWKKWLYGHLTNAFVVSDADKTHFQSLNRDIPVDVCGDTRFDQVLERLKKPKPLPESLKSWTSGGPTLVLGSTWPEDEREWIPCLKKLTGFQLIVVPHEPNDAHLHTLERDFARFELPSVRLSRMTAHTPPSSLILVDQVGILAELYTLATAAFVGGSFKKTVHSIMEPLAAGCWTVVGPYHRNNREAVDFQRVLIPAGNTRIPAVFAALSAGELTQHLQRLRSLSEARPVIQSEILARTGATARLLSHLSNRPVVSS